MLSSKAQLNWHIQHCKKLKAQGIDPEEHFNGPFYPLMGRSRLEYKIDALKKLPEEELKKKMQEFKHAARPDNPNIRQISEARVIYTALESHLSL